MNKLDTILLDKWPPLGMILYWLHPDNRQVFEDYANHLNIEIPDVDTGALVFNVDEDSDAYEFVH